MIKIDGEVKYFASNSEDIAADQQSVVVANENIDLNNPVFIEEDKDHLPY